MRTRLIVLFLLAATSLGRAETGADGWLRYAPLADATRRAYVRMPSRIVSLSDSPVAKSGLGELRRGVRDMVGRDLASEPRIGGHDAFVLGTFEQVRNALPAWHSPAVTSADGFSLQIVHTGGRSFWVIAGTDERGELYGIFHLLEQIAQGRAFVNDTESPSAPIRWVNQWDNFDGTIERGYAGRSIFFANGHVRTDLTRVSQYGRLLASIGLNGCTVNNVNANLHTLDPAMLKELARIADAFRPWGVRLSLSVDLSSPQAVGGLKTFDPVDPSVAAWWKQKVDEIYQLIPDFGGFVVKADSEGRPGPSQYGRTPAQAANVLARALQPHQGIVMYRGFVYDHHLDWRNLKADRARAGYDNFHLLDGQFEPNVVIQVKNGPIDFQVREPVSPLFTALRHTNEAIELQTTQEYTGQQRHMVFLVPMWKTALDTDMRADGRSTPVKEIIEGKSFHRPLGGFVSVVNVGLADNWLHHPMAMANLYGFGKLAWNPDLTSQAIIDTWTRLTFGNDQRVDSVVDRLQLESWHAYEQYTGPLGLGTLTDIVGPHYGPGIESAERNGWGQWLRADHDGIGMDRTVATGTGYIGQYPPELAATYESLATCPDDLLLFMHHAPYMHVLHSGKTVIQHVYDSHYEGAATAATYVTDWSSLKGRIDDERYRQTLDLLTYQADHAIVWRDAVSEWFLKISGIPDALHRVGNHSSRIEAESLRSEGYTTVDVVPWETASDGKAIVCNRTSACSLTTQLNRPAGTYQLAVQYFDLRDGVASFDLLLNGKTLANWKADRLLPSNSPDGSTSTRFTLPRVHLELGDTLTLKGTPDGKDTAPVDYIEIVPVPSL